MPLKTRSRLRVAAKGSILNTKMKRPTSGEGARPLNFRRRRCKLVRGASAQVCKGILGQKVVWGRLWARH